MSTSSDNLHRLIYKTCFGNGMLVWRGKTLLAHSLPGQQGKPGAARETTKNSSRARGPVSWSRIHRVEPATPDEKKLVHLLESYFSGKRVDFSPHTLPLERAVSTPFQASVLAALAAVPYGETITYSGLAAAAGHPRACRAVGNLMAANPYPVIIPCHRVVRGDGSPGNFSAGAGWKRRLLELEGCPFPAQANPIESR
ncbi:MAG: methylated-DNA--[protein]-cysteine S-methyltransferase [Thermoleophilia bacterium]|nr:methylated-DNA--[protein]-cysteine S-methyltransferase [Thermoleophilia bacterium]